MTITEEDKAKNVKEILPLYFLRFIKVIPLSLKNDLMEVLENWTGDGAWLHSKTQNFLGKNSKKLVQQIRKGNN